MKFALITAAAIIAFLVGLILVIPPSAQEPARPTTFQEGLQWSRDNGYQVEFYNDGADSPEWTADPVELHWQQLENQLREQAGVTVPAYTEDSFGPATSLDLPPRTFAN